MLGDLVSVNLYTTHSITWNDLPEGTRASSPKEAACAHATEGWLNDEMVNDEEPGQREPTVICVRAIDGSVSHWRVTWDRVDAVADAEQVAAP